MPELGKYALDVFMAYGASLVLLIGLIVVSWRKSKAVKAALNKAEAQRDA
ncbi:hypothetical protein RB2150_04538 [Rhodobacterales bacterium HTCC2150]|nr:hypothetical protein RB2150_04538 [Rhodobacterales bacterium HTCC2150] [Rhodobacteraceae bacterium HTCC2150]